MILAIGKSRKHAHAQELGNRNLRSGPVDGKLAAAGFVERDQLALATGRERLAFLRLHGPVLAVQLGARLGPAQPIDHADASGRILDVDDRAVILGCDLHGRVLGAARRAANQKRNGEPLALHLAGDVHHLVERRGDQPRQADHVHPASGAFWRMSSQGTITPRSMTS